jgi:hypothetical protein
MFSSRVPLSPVKDADGGHAGRSDAVQDQELAEQRAGEYDVVEESSGPSRPAKAKADAKAKRTVQEEQSQSWMEWMWFVESNRSCHQQW